MGKQCGAPSGVKPFIVRIEFGIDDNQHFHPADGAVARPGPDHHAEPRLDRQEGLVELHLSPGLALEKVVSFEQSLVVVKPRICADVRDVNRAGEVSHFGQSGALRRTGR